MNKEKQIRKLTWKYFWKQKWEEVKDFADTFAEPLIFIGVILFGMFGGYLIITYPKIMGILFLIIIGGVLLCCLIGLILIFCNWIKSNWEKASKRAREELKK